MNGRADALRGLPSHTSRKIAITGVALAVILAGVAGVALSRPWTAGAVDVTPGVYTLREGNLLYSYHRLSNSDSLFNLVNDPGCRHNLAPRMVRETSDFRRSLSRRLGVVDLSDLPFQFADGSA